MVTEVMMPHTASHCLPSMLSEWYARPEPTVQERLPAGPGVTEQFRGKTGDRQGHWSSNQGPDATAAILSGQDVTGAQVGY